MVFLAWESSPARLKFLSPFSVLSELYSLPFTIDNQEAGGNNSDLHLQVTFYCGLILFLLKRILVSQRSLFSLTLNPCNLGEPHSLQLTLSTVFSLWRTVPLASEVCSPHLYSERFPQMSSQEPTQPVCSPLFWTVLQSQMHQTGRGMKAKARSPICRCRSQGRECAVCPIRCLESLAELHSAWDKWWLPGIS